MEIFIAFADLELKDNNRFHCLMGLIMHRSPSLLWVFPLNDDRTSRSREKPLIFLPVLSSKSSILRFG
jgi:hypothetical protein